MKKWIKMDVQPDGNLIRRPDRSYVDMKNNIYNPPHAIGDRMPEGTITGVEPKRKVDLDTELSVWGWLYTMGGEDAV